jgi:hypothetical protein
MLTSLLIFSRHPCRSTPFRHRDEKPVTVTPLVSAFTKRDACNPFRMRIYENCRVSYPLPSIFVSRVTFTHKMCICKSPVFYSLHTLPSSVSRNSFVCHSYENCRVSTNNSHSGTPHHPLTASIRVVYFHALTNCPSHNPFLLTFMHRMGGVGVPLHFPRFVSQPFRFLVNYLDPIFPGAGGPAEQFPHSTQRPRSRV